MSKSPELVDMFLPELHQTWWAEALAQLRDQRRSLNDPEAVRAIEARVREHYKLRHDVELTRERLRTGSAETTRPFP